MQYGLNRKKTKIIEGEEFIALGLLFISALFLSRVIIYTNKEDIAGIAPFGIAFLITMLKNNDKEKLLCGAIGSVIGYLTISSSISNSSVYIVTILTIVLLMSILRKSEKNIGLKSALIIYALIQIGTSLGIDKMDIKASLILSGIYTVVIIPIYFIIRYGLECFENYNTNYYFTVEEVISIGILGCLIVAGIGDLSLFSIYIREVFAIAFIVSIAYVGGAANGSAIGIAMGLVLGISNGEMLQGIGIYAIIGLVAGLFKDTGRIFSFLSVGVVYSILSLYMGGVIDSRIIEVLLGGIIFLVIPNKVLNSVESEINTEIKNDSLNELHMNQIKEEFSGKIESLSDVLSDVSGSIANLSTNDVLLYKDKSTELINNLADRICSNCEKASECWERHFSTTYGCFEKIIKGKEDNFPVFPAELEKKCMRKYNILDEVDKLVLNMNAEAMNKEKLQDGRKLLAVHMNTMAENIEKMLYDFKKDIIVWGDSEKALRKELNRNSIQYKDVFCFNDKDGKIKVKLNMAKCTNCKYCAKNVLPVVNSIIKRPMMIGVDGCSINPNNRDCTITIKEMPKYRLTSYVGMSVKEGEEYTGDTYSFGNVLGGKYLTILSDGMGSGPEASKESKMTVDLVEKFIDSGFSMETALNTVNSIMAMKFDEDEKYSTLDMNTVDLYTGVASFVKVGATSSFIKRGKEIIKISSKMPPFGLVDEMEIESVEKKIKSGDIIITLSDGVLDVDKSKVGDTEWFENYLINSGNDPKDLAIDIIEESKILNNGSIKDDMTVIVSKIQALY
ncbi:stage II sporulation protein E [uncultured Clostridium sp.]|uniref:stage II sporulation protein E n=1 Tax=uncultured Clostridium sp. TaxID=59620 RepID=UPI00262EC90C|nr:stage II sporulation protein E [uncultured Clostridium sp.]